MAALGQKFPVATSDPKALDRVALKANIKGDASKVSVTNGILTLDESTLKFSLNASDYSKPNLAFDLDLDRINVDRVVAHVKAFAHFSGDMHQRVQQEPRLILKGQAFHDDNDP